MKGRSHIVIVILLLLLAICMFCIVNPVGNFPLNDDWVYASPVKYLLETGTFKVTNEVAASMFMHVLWGSLFCKIAGFSFTVLRISVLVLGCIGVVAFYMFTYSLTKDKFSAFFIALLLLVNPIYFSLSNTFMTDVPFVLFFIISMWCFYKSLTEESRAYIVLAAIFSTVTVLIRQAGIIVPLGYLLTAAFVYRKETRQILKAAIPFVIVLICLYTYIYFMKIHNPLFKPYQGDSGVFSFLHEPDEFAFRVFKRIGYMLYYAGFFLLPVTIFSVPVSFLKLGKKHKLIIACCAALFLPSLIRAWVELPVGNVLNFDGIGPMTLKDAYILQGNIPHVSIITSTITLSVAFLGAILLVGGLAMSLLRMKEVDRNQSKTGVFLFTCLLAYGALLFIPVTSFDRYYLPAMIISALIMLTYIKSEWSVGYKWIGMAYIAVFGCFSALGTHDYLAWNRARWEALQYLNETVKVSPEHIDGGYEYNGWMFGSQKESADGKSWWYVNDDEYLVAFGKVDGYKVFKKMEYTRYLPYGVSYIYILHKG